MRATARRAVSSHIEKTAGAAVAGLRHRHVIDAIRPHSAGSQRARPPGRGARRRERSASRYDSRPLPHHGITPSIIDAAESLTVGRGAAPQNGGVAGDRGNPDQQRTRGALLIRGTRFGVRDIRVPDARGTESAFTRVFDALW